MCFQGFTMHEGCANVVSNNREDLLASLYLVW